MKVRNAKAIKFAFLEAGCFYAAGHARDEVIADAAQWLATSTQDILQMIDDGDGEIVEAGSAEFDDLMRDHGQMFKRGNDWFFDTSLACKQ